METSAPMEFTVEAAGPCRKRVSVTIPPTRVMQEFDKSYKNLIKTVPIAGFRQGRAPRKLVEKRFGKEVALEVKQALLDAAFEEAFEKNQLSPITDPELDLEKIEVEPLKPVAFDFTVTVKPEFELPDLKGIEVTVPSPEPRPEQVEAALLALRKRRATLRPLAKGAIREGDVVTLRVHGRSGDKELLHDDNLAYEVGSRVMGGLLVEGLDEALVGKEAGAVATAKAHVPPYMAGHALEGVELAVEAEALEVKRPDLPELDDAFAKNWDFDSKDELLKAVTEDVLRRNERDRDRLVEDLALAQLVLKSPFELPKELVEREAEDLARRAAYEMQMRGEPEEEIARKVADLRTRRAGESERELKAFFVLDKIVEKERILVTETEVREAVAQVAAYNEKTPEQMYALLRDSGRLSSLRNQLRERKARDRLRAKAKVTETPAAPPEDAPAAKAPKTPKKPKKKS